MADPDPQPAKHGERALWCPSYSDCLTRACQEGWPGWTCENCQLRHHVAWADPDPPFAIRALVWAVLHPIRWARWCAMAEEILKSRE
jgi:hypothetical protein